MIASEKRHNTNLLDASFSSYATQERFIIKLSHPQINTKKKVEDDELGIFGAEKYFTGAIDEELNKPAHFRTSNRPHDQERCPKPKPKTTPSGTPSVRSESSWNSRRGLLATNGADQRKKTGVKSLLASLGCNCNDKASVNVTDNKVHRKDAVKPPVKASDLDQKTKSSLSSRWADDEIHMNKFKFDELNVKRDDCFTFPVLNSSMADAKHPDPPEVEQRYSPEAFGSPAKKSFSLERKLTMLNWDGVTPRAENIDNILRHNDTGSDASSDLFEIESFSTNENNSFLSRQPLENSEGRPSNANGYAPSEASVDWSVVTACAADFSTADDLVVSRSTVKSKGDVERVIKGSGVGILSGCHSLKAVRVSGDEYCMAGGGEKAGPARREWSRRLDSATPLAKIQADTKLVGVGVGSDSNRGQNGFGTTRLVPRTHASSQYYL